MKKKKWAVEGEKRVGWVADFIRKYIKLDPNDSLVWLGSLCPSFCISSSVYTCSMVLIFLILSRYGYFCMVLNVFVNLIHLILFTSFFLLSFCTWTRVLPRHLTKWWGICMNVLVLTASWCCTTAVHKPGDEGWVGTGVGRGWRGNTENTEENKYELIILKLKLFLIYKLNLSC